MSCAVAAKTENNSTNNGIMRGRVVVVFTVANIGFGIDFDEVKASFSPICRVFYPSTANNVPMKGNVTGLTGPVPKTD